MKQLQQHKKENKSFLKMKAKLVEEICPKCNGVGLEPEKVWCVDYCNSSPFGCYRETGKKVICKTCMGLKTITILEVSESY